MVLLMDSQNLDSGSDHDFSDYVASISIEDLRSIISTMGDALHGRGRIEDRDLS